ncbi:MAG: AAA family ATPase [Candidatus Gracilibacteria bacterium]|nr:AAA family ATPase [Candidatus Gracilibacteria bacterium]
MKIDRIKQIKNIGIFKDFSGGSLGFDNFTIIFGLNTYGKTTLTDILSSLKYNDIKALEKRKTLPYINISQEVDVSFNNGNQNVSIKFDGNTWNNSGIGNNIEIFGTEFIYKNLFTGVEIERENKENFTDFIIGDSGVQLVQNIQNYNKKLNEEKKTLKNLLPSEYQKTNIVDMDIQKYKLEEVNSGILTLENLKKEKEESLKNPTYIKGLPNIDEIFFQNNLSSELEKLNYFLYKEYSSIEQNVLEKFQEHVSNNFIHKDLVGNWIKTGFDNLENKNGNCIFCTQSLNNVQDIIQLYSSFFSIEYTNFIKNITRELHALQEYFNQFKFIEKEKLQLIYEKANKFTKYVNDDGTFQGKLDRFFQNIEGYKIEDLKNEFIQIKALISEKIDNKLKQPYIKQEKIETNKINNLFDVYIKLLSDFNALIIELRNNIDILKRSYDNLKNIRDEINELDERILKGKQIKFRIENDNKFKQYKEKKEIIEKLEQSIQDSEKKLRIDQSVYLEKYFQKINELFKKFGGSNFELKKSESNRGNKPIYFLELLFHGEKIEENNMKKVFSESDRRALALSIFWAKIELLEEEVKSKMIIILDDPVTSFDDNRTRNFIDYIKEKCNKVSQIIILVHYSKFLHDYYIFTQNKPKILELQPQGTIREFDFEEFIKSDYMKMYDQIKKFISGGDKIEYGYLRSFIEKLYAPIFTDILGKNIIDTIKQECNSYNHNNFLEPSDVENFRSFTEQLFKKMYPFYES